MKALKRLSMELLALLLSAAPVLADSIVVGTGIPAQDVAAVQAAVDAGGIVTLIGLFNFGEDRMGYFYPGLAAETPAIPLYPGYDPFYKGVSTVFITKSVSIRGGGGAKIIGGRPAFWIGWDGEILASPPASGDYGRDWIPLASGTEFYDSNIFGHPGYGDLGKYRYFRAYRDINVSIDGIESQYAHTFFTIAGAGRDLSYTNNKVYDCIQPDFVVWPFGSGIWSGECALNVAVGLLYAPNFYVQNIRTIIDLATKIEYLDCITGGVLVKDNIIVNQPSPGGGISTGFTNAEVIIDGNVITNAAPEGLHIADNPNTYTIKNNTISALRYGMNIFDTIFPVRADVLNNTVHAATPLRIKGNRNSLIKGNRLQSYGLPQIALLNCRNSVVEGNASLPGSTSDYGIVLSGTSRSNTLSNINFSHLTVTGTYVSGEADTDNNSGTNILVPTCDGSKWLADLGQDNSFEFIAIACLIDMVESCGFHQGIENSLKNKLENAIDSLNRLSHGSVAAAIGALKAFINECEAQRDKKITSAQAGDLIAYARKILAVLRAGH
jgi:hypothetical protein